MFGSFTVAFGLPACGSSSNRRNPAAGGEGPGGGGVFAGEGGSFVAEGGSGNAGRDGGGTGGSSGACTEGFESRVRYLASEVETAGECTFEVQTRSCVTGTWSDWSGTYAEASCTRRTPRDCDGAASATVELRQRYRAASAAPGAACEAEVQTRECRDGTWTPWNGSFTVEQCEAADDVPCGATPHGGRESRLRYENAVVAPDAECRLELQERSCSLGVWSPWSGSYEAESCAVMAPRACDETPHAATQSRVRYAAAVAIDTQCVLEVQTRTCFDGTWSSWTGSYAEPACDAKQSDPCVPGYDICAVCGGAGPIRYYTDQDGDGFGDPAEPRDLCPGADSFGLVRNAADLDPACFTRKGFVRIQTPAELAALERVCEIDGDVEIVLESTAEVARAELPALERIHGKLSVPSCPEACDRNKKLGGLRLESLIQTEQISLGDLSSLGPVELPALHTLSGDLSVGRSSLLDLSSLIRVEGNVTFGSVGNVELGSLQEIVGSFRLTSTAGLKVGSLTTVGALKISGPAREIEQSAFPKLRAIANALEIRDVPELYHVSFPALEAVRDLSFVNAPLLSYQISFPKLTNVENFTLAATDVLNFPGFGAPAKLRNISVLDNEELSSFRCGTGGDAGRIRFSGNPRLDSIDLYNVASAESISVASDRLSTVSFEDLENVAGDLIVAGDSLQSLYLPKLRDVDGDLEIRGGQDVLRLPSFEKTGGSFVVSSTGFSSIEAPKLVSVGARLEITDNASLPACIATRLALQVGKTCTCTGNDGSGTCPPSPAP